MAEIRVQVAYHWKSDPAQMIPGAVRIPETITRTIAIGDEFVTDKMSSSCLSPADRAAIIAELDKQTTDANRVARPADEAALEPVASSVSAAAEDEMSAF
jgi:hypothetical protein